MIERIKCPGIRNVDRVKCLNKSMANWMYSKPMRELMHLFGVQADCKKDLIKDNDNFVNEIKMWNQRGDGKERWKIENQKFVEDNKKIIMKYMDELGMTDNGVPDYEPDYILPLGGARYTNLIRPKEAKYLLDKYAWNNKIICGLACYRKKSEIENESWLEYCPKAYTEFDAMSRGLELAFQLDGSYSDKSIESENVNLCSCVRKYNEKNAGSDCYCLAAPSLDPTRRANTYETVEYMLEELQVQAGAKLLFTTSNIYTTTQLLRLMPLALQYDLQIDCVGISAINQGSGKGVLEAGHYLQELYDAICAIGNIVNTF